MTHQDAEEFGHAPNEPHDPQGRPVKSPTMSKFIIKGSYTYKVQKTVEADSKEEAIELALNHSEPMCEWEQQDQDTYSEEYQSIEESDNDTK